MKIVFFGTTNLALPILEALRTQYEILAVVTTPDAKAGRKQDMQETPVSALATDLKLPLFKPESFKNNPEFLGQLSELGADMFVVVAYGKILPKQLLDLPKYKALNLHPSALPKYRGPSPIRTALLNGDEFTAVTFMLMDEQMDHGPIVAQEIVKIEPNDNNFTLEDKLGRVGKAMVNQVIDDYVTGRVTPLPQDEARASVTKIINKEDGQINWQQTAQEIYNQFRAFYLWPGIWTTWNGKKIKLLDVYPSSEVTTSGAPGTVSDGGIILCGNGTALQIKSLQPEGKSEMDIVSFLNGYRDFVGSILE